MTVFESAAALEFLVPQVAQTCQRVPEFPPLLVRREASPQFVNSATDCHLGLSNASRQFGWVERFHHGSQGECRHLWEVVSVIQRSFAKKCGVRLSFEPGDRLSVNRDLGHRQAVTPFTKTDGNYHAFVSFVHR
jgi:hypothetical protein